MRILLDTLEAQALHEFDMVSKIRPTFNVLGLAWQLLAMVLDVFRFSDSRTKGPALQCMICFSHVTQIQIIQV